MNSLHYLRSFWTQPLVVRIPRGWNKDMHTDIADSDEASTSLGDETSNDEASADEASIEDAESVKHAPRDTSPDAPTRADTAEKRTEIDTHPQVAPDDTVLAPRNVKLQKSRSNFELGFKSRRRLRRKMTFDHPDDDLIDSLLEQDQYPLSDAAPDLFETPADAQAFLLSQKPESPRDEALYARETSSEPESASEDDANDMHSEKPEPPQSVSSEIKDEKSPVAESSPRDSRTEQIRFLFHAMRVASPISLILFIMHKVLDWGHRLANLKFTFVSTKRKHAVPQKKANQWKLNTKTLVIDLDETLVHSYMRYPASGRSRVPFGLKSRNFEVQVDDKSLTYTVLKRPYVDYFLRKVSSWYKVVIFTASVPQYANPVIDWLDGGDGKGGLVNARFFRDDCIWYQGTYVKDLSVLKTDLANICLIDNSPASYAIQQANGVPVEGWLDDPSDSTLLNLLPLLDGLRFVSDVRHILGIRGFGADLHTLSPIA